MLLYTRNWSGVDPNLIPPAGATMATLDPLYKGADATLSNGNLTIAVSGGAVFTGALSTLGKSTGKWYWEISHPSPSTGGFSGVTFQPTALAYAGFDATSLGYQSTTGDLFQNNVGAAYGASFTTGDVLGIALNMTDLQLQFYKNGVGQGIIDLAAKGFTGKTVQAHCTGSSLGPNTVNFGATAFAFTPPVGFNRGMWLEAGQDLYFTSVRALLHFDGADAGTTFTDVRGHTFTGNGNAQLDTAQKVFGTASLLLDGTGDSIQSAASTDWDLASNSFTIEGWVRPAAALQNAYLCGRRTGDTAATVQWSVLLVANALFIEVRDTANAALITKAHTVVMTENVWYSWAVVRNGNDWILFTDGVASTTTSAAGIVANAANLLRMGISEGGLVAFALNGHLEEFRITNGVARYTANYTPSTSPFPDS